MSMWTGLPAVFRWWKRRRPRRAARSDSGFTLLEVLVAFTILALMMTVLLRIFSEGFRGMSAADTYAVSVRHAQSALAGVGVVSPLIAGESSGVFADGFRWSIQVAPYTEPGLQSEPPAFAAYQIGVVVDDGRGRGRVELADLRITQPETTFPGAADDGAAPR